MLDKLKVTMFVGAVLTLLQVFGLNVPEDFTEAVGTLIDALFSTLPLIIAVIAGWFQPESKAKILKLKTR